jgi:hypothetical protein
LGWFSRHGISRQIVLYIALHEIQLLQNKRIGKKAPQLIPRNIYITQMQISQATKSSHGMEGTADEV